MTLETQAREYIEKVDALGGSVRAIEQGYIQREIEEAAYRYQRSWRSRSASSSASTASSRRRRRIPTILRSIRRWASDRRRSWRRCASGATTPRSARRWRRWRGGARQRESDAAHPRRRRGATRRSARSATRCAPSSASSTPNARCEATDPSLSQFCLVTAYRQRS